MMRTQWNGLIIHDYEETFPQSSIFELDLYAYGLQNMPPVILADPDLLGTIRSPGVVHASLERYNKLTNMFRAKCFDLEFSLFFRERLRSVIAKVEYETNQFEIFLETDLAERRFPDYFKALTNLMAFHVVNWLLPLDEFTSLFTRIVGERLGRECLLSLFIPYSPGHLYDFQLQLMESLRDVPNSLISARSKRQAVLERLSFLEHDLANTVNVHWGNGLGVGDLENDINFRISAMIAHRKNALKHATEMLSVCLYKTLQNPDMYLQLEAISIMARASAEAEEARKHYQLRSLRNLYSWSKYTGIPLLKLGVKGIVDTSWNGQITDGSF